MPHYAYIARCGDGSLYVGTCVDLAAREALHNAGKASKYTRSRLPVAFVYHEEHPTLSAVRKREAALKKLTRAEKLSLLRSSPTPGADPSSYSRASARKNHRRKAQTPRRATDRRA